MLEQALLFLYELSFMKTKFCCVPGEQLRDAYGGCCDRNLASPSFLPEHCIEQSSKGEFSVKQLASMASGPDDINLMSSKAC